MFEQNIIFDSCIKKSWKGRILLMGNLISMVWIPNGNVSTNIAKTIVFRSAVTCSNSLWIDSGRDHKIINIPQLSHVMGSLVPQTESMIEQCFTSGLINTGVCGNGWTHALMFILIFVNKEKQWDFLSGFLVESWWKRIWKIEWSVLNFKMRCQSNFTGGDFDEM